MPYFFLQPCFWGFFLFVSGSLFAQMPDYAHPINGPLLVTGTFGELRGDHFHAGLDFRASVGTPVYSIGDGYISRIKISAGGYGQAIYIDHPEGYRSVYCHLSGLRSDLMDSVRARQYQREKFVIDLRFDSLTFPVKRGDKIGAVGNRGYSFGPHLHFEIRDSRTDAGLNPLDFGMNVPDTRRPTIRSLKVYELDKGGNTLQEHEIRVVRRGNGVYYLPDPVAVSSSHIGIGIKAYDQQNALNNFNGIFRGELRYDSISLFAFQFRNIPFELTRYLNAHTDYRAWTAKESWYHRLFRLPGDELGIYEVSSTQQIDGQLYVKDGMIRRIPGQDIPLRIFITDQAGNFSTVDFSLTDGADSPLPTGPAYQYFLPQNEASIIDNGRMRMEIPVGALYTDCYFRYQSAADYSEGVYSDVHHLHDPLTPVHRAIQLSLQPTRDIPLALRDKIVLAECSDGRNDLPTSYGGAIDSSSSPIPLPIIAFGDYCLLLDTIPPEILPVNFRTPLRGIRQLSFRITDNFATAGRARGLRYQAKLDGKWILMEYDLKKDLIFYDLPTPLSPGPHQLAIRVWDDRGNEAVWQREVYP